MDFHDALLASKLLVFPIPTPPPVTHGDPGWRSLQVQLMQDMPDDQMTLVRLSYGRRWCNTYLGRAVFTDVGLLLPCCIARLVGDVH